MTRELLGFMTDATTLGIKNTTWATAELASAGLLALITLRSTHSEVKRSGGIGSFLKPSGDSWSSASSVSTLLITAILIKAAIDAAKAYHFIGGISAASQQGYQTLNGYGQQNYF